MSDVIIDVLADAGAKRIYGITGDALNGFVEALRIDGRVEWVGVSHEESAAFAAYADSELLAAAWMAGRGWPTGRRNQGALSSNP